MNRETRERIAARMRGNKNATGKAHTYRFRPSVSISHRLADLIAANNCPFELTWRSGGRTGICTNDEAYCAAWVKQVQALGFKVRNAAPQRITTKIQTRTKLLVDEIGEPIRCAECDCGDGPCNWIQPVATTIQERPDLSVHDETVYVVKEPWDD